MNQFHVKDKIAAVMLVKEIKENNPRKSVTSIAEEMGVNYNTLYGWVKAYDSGLLSEDNAVSCSRNPSSNKRISKTAYRAGDKLFKKISEARKHCIHLCGGIIEERKVSTVIGSRTKATYLVDNKTFSSSEDASNYCIEKIGIYKVKNVFA